MGVPPASYYKAADTAAPTVLIRDIRGLPRRSLGEGGLPPSRRSNFTTDDTDRTDVWEAVEVRRIL